jgi:NodT family efflux transporter outer membrane factor (OMF) lipoprotein
MSRVRSLLLCAVLPIVAACASTSTSDKVELPIPQRWQNFQSTPNHGKDLSQWWKGYNDDVLDRLVSEALAGNQDLVVARARVREALAGVTAAESLYLPGVDLGASASRSKDLTRVLPIVDNRVGNFTASWEPDFFGGRSFDAQAAQATARGADEALRAAQVGLIAELARNYFELRGVQARVSLLERSIDVQRETLRLAEGRFRAGLVTDLDVARATAQLEGLQATLPELEAEAAARSHRIGVLLGKPPATETISPRGDSTNALSLPALPELLPSELLEQRPDLRRAREEVSARAAELGSSKSDLFPKFFLSASVGQQRARINPLPYRSADVFSIATLLTAPIFHAGRIRAGIEAADARLAQAAAVYEKTFLEALEDVENAYVAHASALVRREHVAASLEAATRARQRAEALYANGATDYLTVLDTQRTAVSAEDSLVRSATSVATSLVGLYRAFGGGWAVGEDESEQGRDPDGG